ncbi:hypothetical protein SNE40_009204 [Patella caerulea]|uniref:SRCR domain-containing protein n=1 Tax=Patella caerulea TaxID=87958 RepID=A0AAN8JTL8_PATCE
MKFNGVILTILCCVTQTFCVFVTPPPMDGDKPVFANGIVYYLNHIPDHCKEPRITTYSSGGIIRDKRALVLSDSPHVIYGNIEIAPTGCLYIQPGCELRFGPGFGIIVNGTLIARGSETPGERIVMTKDKGLDTGIPSGDWSTDSRLVDGNTTQDGRLELLYKGLWRGICTNYVNFTEIDANVTCRHLGFLKGNFTYHSFTRNQTEYMLFEKPDCGGTENSLFDCGGSRNIRLGHHICDGQQVIGFECEGMRPGLALDHWRGLEFYNSTLEEVFIDDNIYINKTYSFLEYLDILYAGLNTFNGRGIGINYPLAAISASPFVPLMNNVTIKYSAYDAMNLTEIRGSIHIANGTIKGNRGYGIFIQTAVGGVLVNQTNITNNWGDGIKMQMRNLTIVDFIKEYPWDDGFCSGVNIGSQTYPVYEFQDVMSPDGRKPLGSTCDRLFTTTKDKKVTVHFMMMQNDPLASATLEIRDGSSSGKVLGLFNIANGSYPQSVTTKTQTAHIQLKYSLPRNRICPTFKPCIRFLILIETSNYTAEDFALILSEVSNNTGYGVNVEDMRCKVFFNTTEISHNMYGAGIRVYGGAGEVTINNTLLEENSKCGVNITYAGGFQLINNSRIINNHGYGVITEYERLNRTRFESELRLQVVRTHFIGNEWIGLRIGNYCKGGNILVNESYFAYNMDEAIEYLSCNISTQTPTNFSVDLNEFDGNFRHGILIHPLINTVGIISNNTFKNHSIGALRIDNGYDLLISRWYRQFHVDYNIFENKFMENNGRYAASLRLTQDSPFQKMYFKYNDLRNNEIHDLFMYLNPRNRANAVLVVSSGNIEVKRNWIENPASIREIATHLIDPSVQIDGTQNYWGFTVTVKENFKSIHEQIFDQDDRYNLAQINYYPVLNTERLYDNFLSDQVATYKWQFNRGNYIGGILETGIFEIRNNEVYHVDRDIYIYPGATLRVNPGAILEFDSSTGMVVHGCLKADGGRTDRVISFKLWEEENVTAVENRTASVRLMDGLDEYEGRLEVEINNEWGTVCDLGWIEQNSVLVCQQLGLTFNPFMAIARQRLAAPSEQEIFLSWVTCDELDTDLTKCKSIRESQPDCTHNQDVFIRCQPPTWSGITIPPTQKDGQACQTQIRHVSIQKAGLLDHSTMSYTPALRIDYNYFQISFIEVRDSLSDGIHIKFNHPYSENKLEYANLVNNAGNGLVTRSPRIDVQYSNFTKSGGAGFVYDSFFTEYDALLVRNSIHSINRIYLTQTPFYRLGDRSMVYLLCDTGINRQDQEYYTEIETEGSSLRITLQVLDYSPQTDIEEVIVYDSKKADITATTKKWVIEDDLIDFPVVSSSNYLTIKLHVKGIRSGRLAFVVISEGYRPNPPVMLTKFFNCTFNENKQGIVTYHYNNPSNIKMELYHRHKEETIHFERVYVYNSQAEAMHMPSVTKYNDDYIPTLEELTRPQRVASIYYNIKLSHFIDNAKGILAEHNHVDFANNVWHWFITESEIRRCREGGLEIELPRVNDMSDRKKHSLFFTESTVADNRNFAFALNGYYCNANIVNNNFLNNVCRKGFLTISGMEKNINITNNLFRDNFGRYVIDMDITSHSEYADLVIASIMLNELWNNRYFDGLVPPGAAYSPKTYALAVRGLQNVIANRNLFNNPDLGYELVAGITALSLGNPVDVKENWWGATDDYTIRNRIFDFDDWNNYVIASYFPFLTLADVNSDLAIGDPVDIPLDPSRLGGRVNTRLILPYKREPYVVYSDLTVMPEASLTIEPGTELHFRPNVGILVLGILKAEGLPFSRIKMKPLRSTVSDVNSRSKRATSNNIRLRGGETTNEGFLELYNSSSKSWNIMCDSQFNEKTAEVVCRELGLETINVRVRFTSLYDHFIFGKPMYFRKEFWFNRYYCRGDETNLQQCMKRYNYNLLPCIYAANYTFVRCGERNLEEGTEYWGNIRFSTPGYQEEIQRVMQEREESIMQYVDIEGAGLLHGEKVGAIQTTYVTPRFENINITKCVHNGYDIIAPRDILQMNNQNVTNNLGFGINVLVLNGKSNKEVSTFKPLGISTVPYHVYGLVDICRMEKEITLNNRMILYYKYSHKSVDCVKIIRSDSPLQTLGVRFLQLNLFEDYFSRNLIEIFDGKIVSDDTMIGEIRANSSERDVLKLFESTGNTITVHIHASVSHETFGFIAEVLTIPFGGLTYPDDNYKHTFSNTVLRENQDGAIQYKNIGEISPSLFINKCWIEDNGVAILNLTSPATIDISLHGTKLFGFDHNFVSRNKGGTYLSMTTSTIVTAIRGNLTHNVFAFGTNGEALNISGHYYQKLLVYQNYIFNNSAGDYRDVIHIKDVVVNFTYNAVKDNIGHNILGAYNSEQAQQLYTRSGFDGNNATALYESTIKIGRGKPLFKNNYLVNELNDFEMEAPPKIDNIAIEAVENWWGSDRQAFISGKVWDAFDEKSLAAITVLPPKLSNRSVVEGDCLPGWKLDSGRCYRYMGAAVPFDKAIEFCKLNEGYLADARNRGRFLEYLLRLMRNVNEPQMRVWVNGEVRSRRCSSFEYDYVVEEEDCTRLLYPFICEKDPYIQRPDESTINALAIGIGAGVGSVIIIILLVICILMIIKSRQRKIQRFERTASMRSSIRGSIRSKSMNTILTTGTLSRTHIDQDERYSQSSYGTKASYSQNGSNPTVNGSMGSLHSLRANRRGYNPPTTEMERKRREAEEDERRARENHAYKDSTMEDEDSYDEDEFSEVETENEETSPVQNNTKYDNVPGYKPQNQVRAEINNAQRSQSNGMIFPNDAFASELENRSKSLSSFSNTSSTPTTPIKENIFLPSRSDLPSPPPDPRITYNPPTPVQRDYTDSPKPSPRTVRPVPPTRMPRTYHSQDSLDGPQNNLHGSMAGARHHKSQGSVNVSEKSYPTQDWGNRHYDLPPMNYQPPSYEEASADSFDNYQPYVGPGIDTMRASPSPLIHPGTDTMRNPNTYYRNSPTPSHTSGRPSHVRYMPEGNTLYLNNSQNALQRRDDPIETEI